MPSRDELEQDLMIVEAERDAAQKRVYELEKELAARGGELAIVKTRAAAEGVDVEVGEAEIDERRELEVLRDGVDRDLEALNELRSPQTSPERAESALDIVRANQRERATLQELSQKSTQLLSRIASIMKLDRWDEDDGEKLLERVQKLAHARLKTEQLLKTAKKKHAEVPDLDPPDPAAEQRKAFQLGAITALESVLALGVEKAPVDPDALRRITFMVSGNPIVYHCPPDATVAKVRETVLSIQYPPGSKMPVPTDHFLIFDENGTPLPTDKLFRDVQLPTACVVITAPVGYGG